MIWIHFLLMLIILLFAFFRKKHSYWEKLGIPTSKYVYVFGHLGPTVTLKKSVFDIYTDIYRQFKDHNYVGFYKFMTPGVIIRNPEVIKDILIKYFSNFHDNDLQVDENVDPILGRNPFVLTGERWKKVRNQITPAFNTSKIKAMIPLLQENVNKLITYLAEEERLQSEDGMDAKELSAKFTCDNVASCAFGLDGQSFTDPKAKFREVGRDLTEFSAWVTFKLMLIFMFPSLQKLLTAKFIPDATEEFLKTLIKDTVEYRKKENIVRNDFIDMMTELKAKINDENEFNDVDITAHAGSFYVDGFETSSIVLSYTLYELAANPDIQERLFQEVRDVLKRHNSVFTYEAINDMTYLDCVIKENLRKNVPLGAISRICTEPYKLPPLFKNNTGPEPTLDVGTPIIIPVIALHMDEEYFPDPDRFFPDRFADENKDNILKCTYLPFGEGPRMCLGLKFGVLQTKMGVASIIANYMIKVNKRTKEPLVADPKNFLLAPIGGIWLDFCNRKQ